MPVTRYVQVYSNYDKAMVDWVHSLEYRERPLLVVFASPERAFAQMERVLRERTGETKATIPLPFASVERLSEEFDPSRFNNGYFYRAAANEALTKWYGFQRPVPYNFLYQLDIWAKTKKDLDIITTQLSLRLFSNYTYLTVQHPSIPTADLTGITELDVFMQLQGTTEKSEIAPGREQRVLRRSFTYMVQGWKCYEADEYGIVEKVVVAICDYDLVTLGSVTITAELTD